MEVDERASHHKDVEELMRVKPDVTLAGEEALGDAGSVQGRPVMYRPAMSNSQPICPMVAAFRKPSEMT